ncbi:CheR family methyltransferase [Paramagnetospirillum magneticum]|uniref:protein-glutamate O-methyltransferase n=1 Tax=Paramagnetospirillum magneticum (strain ATCC 700264 / AMB-1) TaxID=342108 RepID=Q2W5V8_PARM1|nr:protein-glutamate O-methyltransferase CheR [Paramagnetospirillum magneticum]BAE50767.1 Methylase of chemotaxis methyl-accepting protein [Paramagnetospirillum magneticum AMB-1]
MSLPSSGAPPAVAALLDDPAYSVLKALIIDTTGMAFYRDKDSDLARILAERMAEIGIGDCAGYLDRLHCLGQGKAEMDALIAELTIGETYFFRHKEQFDALRDLILPEAIERNRTVRRLRIWSAGCATGPEPYSVAIMLEREFGERIAGWHVTVLGTDINQKFLSRAREGRYDEWAFRTMSDSLRAACFEKVGNQWQIRPEFKRNVSFQYHNLIKSPFPSLADNIAGFDIIICRNVIIYFSQATVESLVPCFRESLNDGGWLIMGHAEPNQRLFADFRTVNTPGAVLYQRVDRPYVVAEPSPPVPPPLPLVSPPPVVRGGLPAKAPTSRALPPKALSPRGSTSARPGSAAPAAAAGGAGDFDRLTVARNLADSGQWEKAAAACDAIIAASPLDAWAYFYRAMVHEQLGEDEPCEKALRRAIYLDRRLVLPHYHLGLFLARKDDSTGAERSFRNAQALLAGLADEQPVNPGEKIAVGQMREAVAMHLKLLGGA